MLPPQGTVAASGTPVEAKKAIATLLNITESAAEELLKPAEHVPSAPPPSHGSD